MMQVGARENVDQHHDELAEERHHDQRFRNAVQRAQRNAVLNGNGCARHNRTQVYFDAGRHHEGLSAFAKRW